MKRALQRAAVLIGTGATAIVLSGGPALAHYCANYNKNADAGTMTEVDLKNGKTVVRGAWDGHNMERTSFPVTATLCGSADNGAVIREELLAIPDVAEEVEAISATLSCNQDAGAGS